MGPNNRTNQSNGRNCDCNYVTFVFEFGESTAPIQSNRA